MTAEKSSTMLDIDQIAERTGIQPRALRYVVDYDLLGAAIPWFKDMHAPRRGVPRTFSKYFAYLLALAASLRKANLGREALERALRLLADWATPNPHGTDYSLRLYPLFEGAEDLELEIGDGECLRAGRKSGVRSGSLPKIGLPWTDLGSGQSAEKGYRPIVISRIETGLLRRRLDMR